MLLMNCANWRMLSTIRSWKLSVYKKWFERYLTPWTSAWGIHPLLFFEISMSSERKTKLEQILFNILMTALKPVIQLLTEIRDLLAAYKNTGTPPTAAAVAAQISTLPTFVAEIPQTAVQVGAPAAKTYSREELGRLAVEVAKLSPEKAKSTILPYQVAPPVDGQHYPAIGNIDPKNYSAVYAELSSVLAVLLAAVK